MAIWKMTCLLCDTKPEYLDLVAIQEHAMDVHGYTQDDHRQAQRIDIGDGGDHFKWAFPDGKEWMVAKKVTSE